MKYFLEQFEDSAERRFDEMTEGLPVGKFKCGCGDISDLDNTMPASAHPYSEPVCGKCYDEMLEERYKQMKPEELLRNLAHMFYVDEEGGLEWRYLEGIPIKKIGEEETRAKLLGIERAFAEYLPEEDKKEYDRKNKPPISFKVKLKMRCDGQPAVKIRDEVKVVGVRSDKWQEIDTVVEAVIKEDIEIGSVDSGGKFYGSPVGVVIDLQENYKETE